MADEFKNQLGKNQFNEDRDAVNKTRQQLGYSESLTKELEQQRNLTSQILQNYNFSIDAHNKLNKKSEDAIDLAKELQDTLSQQKKEIEDTTNAADKWYELNQKLAQAAVNFKEALDKSRSIYTNLGTEGQKLAQTYIDGLTAQYKINDEIRIQERIQKDINDLLDRGGSLSDQAIQDLDKELLLQTQKIDLLSKEIEGAIKVGNLDATTLENLSEQEKILLAQFIQQQKIMDTSRNIEKNHRGQFEQLNKQVGILDKIRVSLSKVKLISDGIDWGKAQLATIGISFTAILKNVLEYNKYLTDSANQLGISVNGARELADNYQQASYNTEQYNKNANAALMTIKAQFEAQGQLNAALGTAGLFTAKARIDQAFLTKQVGLQGDEAAKLYQLGRLNGATAEDTAKIVAQEVINSGKQNGNKLDYKKVLQDVAKTEGQLAVMYDNNPKLIAEAVTQAKQLGIELGQAAKMSDSLLNFQSSIENELKAELLTGKAMNLELAREYALRGDVAKAAKELMDNVGGLSEFQELNVIQQRSLADAIGLGVDELSNALKTQELLKGSAWETEAAFKEAVVSAKTQEEKDKLRQQILQSTNAEQLLAQSSQISNQEKFTAAIDKLKESLANIVDGPFGKLLDGFAKMVSSAETLKGLMTAIGVIIAGQMLKGIASFALQMAASIAPTSAVAAASLVSASAFSMGLGIAAIIGGAAAAISMLNSATGENINVSGATGGGGINTNAMARPNTNNTSTQSDKPIVVHIDNRFDVGNRGIATIATRTAQNTSPHDKPN